jgi:hypothetical protein
MTGAGSAAVMHSSWTFAWSACINAAQEVQGSNPGSAG